MSVVLFRRRGLGKGSCSGIVEYSESDIKVVRNDSPLPLDTSLIIRWGCTSRVPEGIPIMNKTEAIHRVANKTGFRKLLMEKAPVTIPNTIFRGDDYEENIKYVVRPATHSQGRHVYLATNPQEFNNAMLRCNLGWYASEYIPKVAEYRVCFVQGRVCWVAKKTPADPEAIAWNVALGGRFENVRWNEWPLEVVSTAYEAFKLSGLDFSGIDVMVGPDNKCYILEANSAPSMTSNYRKKCIAKCIDWIVNTNMEHLLPDDNREGWRKWIHPALLEQN